MSDKPHSRVRTREQLLAGLTLAAELEHNLACMYLFAAFSIKTKLKQFDPDYELTPERHSRALVNQSLARDYKTVLLAVARQEMEHLGYVCNLLNAVGGAQHFTRPNFPQTAPFYGGHWNTTLERFNVQTMNRFVAVEQPANIDPNDPDRYLAFDPQVFTEHDQLVAQPFAFNHGDLVQGLYTALREGMTWLDSNGPDPLFIGNPDVQIDDADINVGFGSREFGVDLHKVTDLESAGKAIDLIIEQGEGVVLNDESNRILEDSHYERFRRVRDDLLDQIEKQKDHEPPFDPALPVVNNPALNIYSDTLANAEYVTTISHDDTRKVMEVFDAGYQIMVFMLIRFFGGGDTTANDRAVLLRTAFFPLMTLVIRPVGEILCEMPAHDEGEERAGPGFGFSRDIAFLPNRETGWEYLAGRLDALAKASHDVKHLWPGLDYVSDSLDRMAVNFRQGIFDPVSPPA